MKQVIRFSVSIILIISLLISVIPVSASPATSGKLDNCNISWAFEPSTGHLTISGSGEMSTGDDPTWLDHKDSIKTVEISNGITTIGDGAFYGCYNLTDIKIPDTVTHIRYRAFMFCESLAAIQLPKNLFKIGERAFSECTALTSIVLPDSVRYIHSYAFDGCNFKELRLNEGIETISPFALHNIEVDSLVIPRSVRMIENNAFNGSEFGQLILQEGLQSIDYYAFWGCTMEAPLILPASVHAVAYSAFQTTVFPYIVIKNPNCDFGDQKVYPPFSSGTTIYAHPNSTASTLVSNFSRYSYVFRPMYFNDVAPGMWYFDAVSYAKENSLFDGVGNGKFAPETTMTRAMMVQVLYNYAGKGEICENPFTDVPNNTWYTNAVAWAAQNGIVNGTGDGKFNPEGKLTREQLASIMFRFTNWQGEDTSKTDALNSFADKAKVSPWAVPSVQWAVGQGLINGVDQNGKRYLQPQAYASRAQVATILMRNIEQIKADKTVELSIFAEGYCYHEIQAAAEEYMAANEFVKIDIKMFDIAFFKDPQFDEYSQIRGEVDLVFSVGDEVVPYLEENNLAAAEHTTPFAITPYVFAVNYGDPYEVQSIERLIEMLKRKEININLAARNTALGKYSHEIFGELGVSDAMFQSFWIDTSVNSAEAAAMVMLGYADSTIVREIDAVDQGLVILGAPEGHEDGDLIYSTIMNKATQQEAAQQFIDFLAQYVKDGAMEQYGYQTIPQ